MQGRVVLMGIALLAAACGSSSDQPPQTDPAKDAGAKDSPGSDDVLAPPDGSAGSTSDGAADDSGPAQPKHDPFCSKDGWCWNKPVPAGHDLRSVAVISANDIWASGLDTVMHWDGSTWDEPMTGLDARIAKLWGVASNDIWGTGFNGGVYRYDGTSWTLASGGTTQTYYGVWGANAKDVWFVGKHGVAEQLAGTVLAQSATGTTDDLNAIWGSSTSDVWAVGTSASSKGTIIHWDGSKWTNAASNLGAGFVDVWGSSDKNVWAVGPSGTVASYDGSAWAIASGAPQGDFVGVWTSGADDVWIADQAGKYQHWDGSAWQQTVPSDLIPTKLTAVRGAAKGDVLSVGEHGVMRRFDGTKWAGWPEDTRIGNLRSIWGAASNDIHVVGDKGLILHGDGVGWTSSASPTDKDLRWVWGAAANDVWAVGGSGTILHFDGSSWVDQGATPAGTNDLAQVWGTDASHVFVVGQNGTVMQWNGSAWSLIHDPTSFDFTCIWGASPDDMWAAGSQGKLERWDGGGWEATTLGGLEMITFRSLWGASKSAVLLVAEPITLFWNGSKWEQYADDMYNPMGVFGTDPKNLWTVSQYKGTTHSDGTTWKQVDSPSGNQLRSIWVGPDQTWAVGDWGTVLRYVAKP